MDCLSGPNGLCAPASGCRAPDLNASDSTHQEHAGNACSFLKPLASQVGLAGPSGSGKTAFSEKVRSFIPGCAVLSMDNYNDASRLIDGNFDGESLVY